ncbi:hypothetical protein [Pleurocapsa sp. FMAR1]|uniref:hypothetical protein n=1 Tax=Pleurocapsa sp. FMAR1 TaxID=3040204 RepID=UPI0029C88890|nr:hypothetical protein [Pleurocapsa sp. FMAR1]
MESIGYFFRRMFDGIIDRLSYQIRYKITNIADSKIKETVENPFNQRAENDQQTTTRQERNNKY